MGLKKLVLGRGGLALLFLFLFLAPSKSPAQEASLYNMSPDQWIRFVLGFQESVQKNQDFVLRFLDFYRNASTTPASEYPLKRTFIGTDNKEYAVEVDFAHILSEKNPKIEYDRTARILRTDEQGKLLKVAEVNWDSKKTGSLPGPEASFIGLQNYRIHLDDLKLNGQRYYRTHMQFTTNNSDKASLRRGYVEILQDIQRQQTKISSSTIEGPADILPNQMKQINLQTVVNVNGYIYLRQDDSVPTRIPSNQRHFCRNPQGSLVNENSREWEEFCALLFDGSIWHGFSFSLIPNTYNSFLK